MPELEKSKKSEIACKTNPKEKRVVCTYLSKALTPEEKDEMLRRLNEVDLSRECDPSRLRRKLGVMEKAASGLCAKLGRPSEVYLLGAGIRDFDMWFDKRTGIGFPRIWLD